MTEIRGTRHLQPTLEQGSVLGMRQIPSSVVLLNLLRFRKIAEYAATPELAPPTPISGAAAFRLYIDHTLPHLRASGGELVFLGEGGQFLIGPDEERWDLAMLVRQRSVAAFMSFAANEAYLGGIGHRSAAIEDSRLLPLVEIPAA